MASTAVLTHQRNRAYSISRFSPSPQAQSTPRRNLATVTPQGTPTPKTGDTPRMVDSPGNWKHPRLQEINQRIAKETFDERNMSTILYSLGIMLALLLLRNLSVDPPLLREWKELRSIIGWTYTVFLVIPVGAIIHACLPLFRTKDDFSDIALTPTQREILGLPQTNKKPSPNSKICTPPRYSRTSSVAGSPASRSNSPLSNKGSSNGSAASDPRMNGNGNSITGSPLFHKAVRGGVHGRRSSWDPLASTSALGRSSGLSLTGDVNKAQSQMPSKRASIGLTNKWQYEKGRRSSSNNWQQQMKLLRDNEELWY